MNLAHLALLQCPECSGDLEVLAGETEAEVLLNGLLGCRRCSRTYPVLDGIGIFFRHDAPDPLTPTERARLAVFGHNPTPSQADGPGNTHAHRRAAVGSNWEFQWQEIHPFSREHLEGEGFLSRAAFNRFVPLPEGVFQGKSVLIGGAGRGREAFHVAAHGARLIVAVELGREIAAIPELLAGEPAVELLLLRADLTALPLRAGSLDLAICDHVLQHVHDHRQGFAELARVTRSGGEVAICVYSWEGNLLMTHVIEPMKAIFHRIPLRILFGLALIPSVLVEGLIRCVYQPLERVAPRWARHLPLREHFLCWAKNEFRTTWMSIFDLLHAPISYHFRREEVERLAVGNHLRVEVLQHTHGVLWSLIGRRP
jgi:SAM-dependent methyltransferase/uncharacterized protein YbaR (Trm112 family)